MSDILFDSFYDSELPNAKRCAQWKIELQLFGKGGSVIVLLSQLFKFLGYSLNPRDIALPQAVVFFFIVISELDMNLIIFIMCCGLYNMLNNFAFKLCDFVLYWTSQGFLTT